AASECDVVASENFACKRYIRSSMAKSEVEKVLGDVCDLGGAYITEKAFAESEFDALASMFDSTLRVL
ncbi:MAG: hypothetical protein IJN48_02165, partial [Clostridia bacterium]|nr:hypothetical protein [Clostridia bacterium]